MGVLTVTMVVMSLWGLPAVAVTGRIDGGLQVNQAICINSTASATSIGEVTATTFDCGIGFPTALDDQMTIVLAATGNTLGGTGVTGQIDGGLQINQTICVNNGTSNSFIGEVTGTTFDCGVGFPSTQGDQITIVLVATGTGGTGELCNTTPLQEQEPNDDFPQSQNVGTLQSGACITVAGRTDAGFGNPDMPDPNADFDYYLFSLVGGSRLRIDFDLAAAESILFSVFDADTQARLEVQSEPGTIEVDVPAQTSSIIFRMSTDVPDSYTLTFSDRSGVGPLPLGTLTIGPRMIEDRP
jgi:hypothetical protein